MYIYIKVDVCIYIYIMIAAAQPVWRVSATSNARKGSLPAFAGGQGKGRPGEKEREGGTQRRQQHSVAPDKGTPPLPLPLSPSAAAISPPRAAAALSEKGEGRGEKGGARQREADGRAHKGRLKNRRWRRPTPAGWIGEFEWHDA